MRNVVHEPLRGPGGPRPGAATSPGRKTGPRIARSAAITSVLVATGVVGAGVIAQAATAGPPPGRAYEIVSPLDRPSGAMAGLTTDLRPAPGVAATDAPDRLVYGAGSALDASWSGPTNPLVVGRRTATGWTARTMTGTADEGNTPLDLGAAEARAGWLSPDGTQFVYGGANIGAAPGIPRAALLPGIYRSNDTDSTVDWISRPNGSILPQIGTSGVVGPSLSVSPGGETIVFSSSFPLTADAPTTVTSSVYARRGDALELVSVLPDGSIPTDSSFLTNVSSFAISASSRATIDRNQVAGNGRFVLFRVGGNLSEGDVYVRDLDRGVTHQLAGGTSVAGKAINLTGSWGATDHLDVGTVPSGALTFAARDGDRAYFRTVAEPYAHQANLATGVVTPRPAITGAPLGLSPDGRRLVFIKPPANGTNEQFSLRYWDESSPGTSVLIGNIGSAGSAVNVGRARVYRSSADGRSWVFTSAGSPDPARPNVGVTTQQLYRWTVGDSTPECLTCRPVDSISRTTGVNLTVHESLATEDFTQPTVANTGNMQWSRSKLSQPGHSVSDDGRWILFDSPDRLIGEDTNDVRDVYMWDRDAAPSQRLQLLSTGQGTTPSWAVDLDPTGTNAYFSTTDSLVPADRNNSYDVYTARIGGGFPDSPESCTGETCRPPVIVAAKDVPVVSDRMLPPSEGPANPEQPGVRALRVRSVRTSRSYVTVRVDVPKAGRVRVSGKTVRTTSRTAKRGTTYTVRVPLSTRTKRQVARGRSVKVRLRVSFTPKGAKKTSSVRASVSVRKGR